MTNGKKVGDSPEEQEFASQFREWTLEELTDYAPLKVEGEQPSAFPGSPPYLTGEVADRMINEPRQLLAELVAKRQERAQPYKEMR